MNKEFEYKYYSLPSEFLAFDVKITDIKNVKPSKTEKHDRTIYTIKHICCISLSGGKSAC